MCVTSKAPGVVIRGSGTAAHCVAHLLVQAGIPSVHEAGSRAAMPALMLNESALALIRDVLGQPDLFAHAHKIERRVVAWTRGQTPTVLPHRAIVVSEADVVEGMRGEPGPLEPSLRADWAVLSGKDLPRTASELRFGNRRAMVRSCWLRDPDDSSACWIESLEEGWLFLIPNTKNAAWLLSVGTEPEKLICESTLIRERIRGLGEPRGEFQASPRIASRLCGSGWIACGSAAMAFDPICGDGTAHAVREAILAVAVIRAARAGEDPGRLQAHYQARLIAGFERHLLYCREFYQSGFGGRWWELETSRLQDGIAWCSQRRSEHSEYHFRLDGYQLLPVH